MCQAIFGITFIAIAIYIDVGMTFYGKVLI